ncbi:MAG TPA: hypothetical protein VM681_03860 [Candidatus Thermoplasmatota archaeon]|nr:hypothetical protein [Candidatus Thermoplasmatota archaeon]
MTEPSREQSLRREREIQQTRERVEQGERPWQEHTGVLSVVAAVRDLRFPTTVEDVAQEAGDREVRISERTQLPLRRVLGKLKDDTQFVSVGDFQTAVQTHWEGIRNLEVPPEQWPPAPPQFRPER